MTFDFRNRNTLWASVLVGTLARLGLTTAVISPGSRSTPLTVAFANDPSIEAIPVLDERSAAFFALGIAKRTGLPVALVCTSGTAGANYYPAIIEARESQVPLLVFTADRPPELRDCASGQTIDQQKLFGDFPQGYTELAVPAADLGLLRYLRQTLVQAWRQSLYPAPGPVHLNCPFRDPLAPISDGSTEHLREVLNQDFWRGLAPLGPDGPHPVGEGPGVRAAPSEEKSGVRAKPWSPIVSMTATIHADLLSTWQSSDRGLIIAGPAQPVDAEGYCQSVAALTQSLQWPILADTLSPLRHAAKLNPYLVTTYDAILRQEAWATDLQPSQVIQLGPLPTSKVLRQWLERHNHRRWVIDPASRNLDPLHGLTTHLPLTVTDLAVNVANFIASSSPISPINLANRRGGVSPSEHHPTGDDLISDQRTSPAIYGNLWLTLDRKVRQHLDQSLAAMTDLFEGKVPWLMGQHLPQGTAVVISNSMPIRDAEWFWPPNQHHLRIFGNRGANGIDGTLSTALGIAQRGAPTVLLTGDLALLHDTNGWLNVPRLQGHLTVVLINNQGGGIFEMLPIAQFDPPFEDFFATPQTVDWNHLCAAYGVNYERIKTWSQLQSRLGFLPSQGVRVLEVRCDRKQSTQIRQALLQEPIG
ncbi:MAG: 2-succinyl-5-enolpyruvyl-6-hydroxy-3-cyclohexene-1-carboxylic-acid synthase [Spirulina sp.]